MAASRSPVSARTSASYQTVHRWAEPTCPYRKLNPDVLVVQSAQNWHRQYSTEWLNSARNRRVLFQGQVSSVAIVVVGISSKQTPKIAHQIPRYGQGIPVGSTRSAFQSSHSAVAIAERSAPCILRRKTVN